MATHTVTINRAPVLTLWAAVVAERLGYDHEAALTLGKAVAGLNAQSKGRRLGVFEEPADVHEARGSSGREPGEPFLVAVLGRSVPSISTEDGVRATLKGQPIDPKSVRRYLAQKFGKGLANVQAAMEDLARAYPPKQLAAQAYALYEQFRPDIPEGKRGWGAAGPLNLDVIRALAESCRRPMRCTPLRLMSRVSPHLTHRAPRSRLQRTRWTALYSHSNDDDSPLGAWSRWGLCPVLR
jgi:hypothetical protein